MQVTITTDFCEDFKDGVFLCFGSYYTFSSLVTIQVDCIARFCPEFTAQKGSKDTELKISSFFATNKYSFAAFLLLFKDATVDDKNRRYLYCTPLVYEFGIRFLNLIDQNMGLDYALSMIKIVNFKEDINILNGFCAWFVPNGEGFGSSNLVFGEEDRLTPDVCHFVNSSVSEGRCTIPLDVSLLCRIKYIATAAVIEVNKESAEKDLRNILDSIKDIILTKNHFLILFPYFDIDAQAIDIVEILLSLINELNATSYCKVCIVDDEKINIRDLLHRSKEFITVENLLFFFNSQSVRIVESSSDLNSEDTITIYIFSVLNQVFLRAIDKYCNRYNDVRTRVFDCSNCTVTSATGNNLVAKILKETEVQRFKINFCINSEDVRNYLTPFSNMKSLTRKSDRNCNPILWHIQNR